MMLSITLALAIMVELSLSHTRHECIHDTEIVPNLINHEDHPFKVVQPDSDDFGRTRLRRLVNATARQDVLQRRLVAGRGSKFRIKPDFIYLEQDKYHCTTGSGTVKNVNRKKGDLACRSEDVITEKKKDYIVKLIEAAIEWFTRALRVVHPIVGQLRLQKYCYQFAPPPAGDANTQREEHCRNPGACEFPQPDADFYLYITANPVEGDTIAWAATCQSDHVTGRPIAGYLNFNPAKLTNKKTNWNSELSTAIHEISHSLGFSASKFGDFIDAETGEPLGRNNVVRKFQSTELGYEVTRIITPKVVEQVRNQFGCHDWGDAGAEIEQVGGEGTAGSHWEKRVFRDEYMTATDSRNPVVSVVSLALFEDSGWYIADYSTADHLHWGHKAGCNFGKHKCSTWDNRFFCNEVGKQSCSHNRLYKGQCNLVTYQSSLPRQYQYFDNPKKGGSDKFSDYCPFVLGYNNGNCQNPDDIGKNGKEIFGEDYSVESRCFDSTIIKNGFRNDFQGPKQRCFKTECKDGLLKVYIDSQPISCPVNGGKIDVGISRFKGALWCPPASELCVAPSEVMSVPPETDELKSDGVKCESVVAFDLGHSRQTIKLDRDQVACLRMTTQLLTVSRLAVVSAGDVVGTLYMQSFAKAATEDSNAVDASGKSFKDEDVPVAWPSASQNDAYGVFDSISDRVSIPESILDTAEILFSFVAAQPVDGFLALELRCRDSCFHRGTCQDGVCVCFEGWMGIRCEDRACPNDCSSHGECDVSSGKCNCNVGWRGAGCDAEDKQNDFQSGAVARGEWAFFYVTCPGNDLAQTWLEYHLHRESDGSDPFLYAQIGKSRPSSSRYVVRDIDSWKVRSADHVVKVKVRNGAEHGATIGIYNSPFYAREDLRYTGRRQCTPIQDEFPCPGTPAGGECNNHGECKLDEIRNVKTCRCQNGWTGDACDVVPVSSEVSSSGSGDTPKSVRMVLNSNEHRYMEVAVPPRAIDHDMIVRIAGQEHFILISVNKLSKEPKVSEPRSCDASESRSNDCHNYWDKYKFKKMGQISQVRIKRVTEQQYTVMIMNQNAPQVTVDVQILFGDSSGSFSVVSDSITKLAVLGNFVVEQDEQPDVIDMVDDPIVPLQLVAEDGGLPDPVLAMSSRSLVEGMANSKHMRLLKVEEFCSQSKLGLYVMCSNMAGTVTVCTDRPAVLFHGLLQPEQPKRVSEFTSRSMTVPGAPSKQWEHLRSWQDSCLNYQQVEVSKDSNYIGVVALEGGRSVTFTAVMQGKGSLFLTDSGEIRPIFGMIGTAVVSSLVTLFLTTTIYFGWWYKKKRKKERSMANARRFTDVLRRSVAATRESHFIELSTDIGTRGALENPLPPQPRRDESHVTNDHQPRARTVTINVDGTVNDAAVNASPRGVLW